MTIAEVDLKIASTFCDTGVDANIARRMAIIIEKCLTLVDAVLPLANNGTHLPLGAIEHSRDGRMGDRRAELREQLPQSPLADARRADHSREIAAEVARVTNVEHDHLVHVFASFSLLI